MTVGGGEIIGGAGVISTEEYHRRQKLTEVMRCFDITEGPCPSCHQEVCPQKCIRFGRFSASEMMKKPLVYRSAIRAAASIQTLNIGYSCVKLNQWLLGVES